MALFLPTSAFFEERSAAMLLEKACGWKKWLIFPITLPHHIMSCFLTLHQTEKT
jgi:hypothetical protein